MKRLVILILLSSAFLSCSKNAPPVIQSLFAVPDSAHPGDTVLLHCAAIDMDGDAISFAWAFQNNPMSSPVWIAPDFPGDFYIHIAVTDRISWVEDSLLIKVRGQSLFRDSRDGKTYRYVTLYNWTAAKSACPAGWHRICPNWGRSLLLDFYSMQFDGRMDS